MNTNPSSAITAHNKNSAPTTTSRPFWMKHLTKRTQYILDMLALTAAFALAYALRFDFTIPALEFERGLIQLPAVLLVQFIALYLSGAHDFVWRYVGLLEMRAFVKAAIGATLFLLVVRYAIPSSVAFWRVPASIIVLDAILAFGAVVSLRMGRRALYERYEYQHRLLVESKNKAQHGLPKSEPKNVLFIGAGRAGIAAARSLHTGHIGHSNIQTSDGKWGDLGDIHVVGFIDDDGNKHGTIIQGLKVFGSTHQLPQIAKELGIQHVVITIASATRRELRRILDICDDAGIKARIIPGLHELIEGKVSVSRIRDVQLEDLLGRDPVRLDEKLICDVIQGRVVLVTGAGGSIGSELCRQVARFQPKQLILVEQAEFGLFHIHRELVASFGDVVNPASGKTATPIQIVPIIADIGDKTRIKQILQQYRPSAVFHAAAHKHVPLMEQNPGEAIKNNVIGTKNLADLSHEFGVERFVMISTDKAVNPTSVMGASKRLAEMYIQSLSEVSRTQFVAVRFGNVLGSNGSVVPIFQEQINKGGPVTVTHPEMKRYFMTIPEASQLVLQAGAMGQGGEIFILDMGEPVKIVELARDLIRLMGLREGDDVEIKFTGMRPGEKLYEEISMDAENAVRTKHPKIYVGKLEHHVKADLEHHFAQLLLLAEQGQPLPIVKKMSEVVTTFTPVAWSEQLQQAHEMVAANISSDNKNMRDFSDEKDHKDHKDYKDHKRTVSVPHLASM